MPRSRRPLDRARAAVARVAQLLVSAALALGACVPVETPREVEPTRAPQAVASAQAQRVQHEVRVDGHPIAVWEKRAAEGVTRAILLIHGRTWSGLPDFDLQVPGERRSLMDALVARGFAVYAVDLRGYGGTPRDDTGWLTPNRAAADVESVLEWMTARERARGDLSRAPALLGWSMGSLVSHLVVQRRPELVSDVVLFGYPRGATHDNPPTPPELLPARSANTAEAAASDFITPEVISGRAIDAFVDMALKADPIKVDWRDLDQFNVLEPDKINVPTLLIHGAGDPYAPAQTQADVFARLGHPDRRWVMIPGGDHAAHLEDTMVMFVDVVVEFLERPRAPLAGGGWR